MLSPFRRNVGGLDQVLRTALGLALLSLTVVGPETPWGLLGLIPLATVVVGWCPLYAVLGVDTCARQQRPAGR